ncbi:MAG TPA: hypothetical protein VGO62_22125 [Myxococcota bacterium]|jgi:hypothetical protein
MYHDLGIDVVTARACDVSTCRQLQRRAADTPRMPVHPTVSDVRRVVGGLVRSDVKHAAGSDNVVDANEALALRPVLRAAFDELGAGSHAVNDIVDRTMARVSDGWGAVNQPSGRGSAFLSHAELRALAKNDADLGAITTTAANIALKNANPLVVALDNAPAGITLDKSGSKYTITADASVAVGTAFNIAIDGHELVLQRGPAGINVDTLVAPPGYGLAVVSRSVMTEPVQTATVSISKDDPAWLSPTKLLSKAKAGLLDFVRHTRIHDADWSQYFPTTWAGNVDKGVPAQIAGFFTNSDTQIERSKDSVLYIGRGPYDLYTEIAVSKKDGKVLHALVEID